MHLLTRSIPQLEFASVCLFLDINNNTTTNKQRRTDKECINDIEASINREEDGVIEIASVTSPLSTISPIVASRALYDLHRHYYECEYPYDVKNGNNGNDKVDDNDTESLQLNEGKEGEELNEGKEGKEGGGISEFQSSCIQEEMQNEMQNRNQHNQSQHSYSQHSHIQTMSSQSHGLTMHYCCIRNTDYLNSNSNAIQNCLSIINPLLDKSSLLSLSSQFNDNSDSNNMSIVICVASTGGIYHNCGCTCTNINVSYPQLSYKLKQLSNYLQSSTSTLKSTSKSSSTSSESEQNRWIQKSNIELMLMSILLHDEYLKTNEYVDRIENGNTITSSTNYTSANSSTSIATTTNPFKKKLYPSTTMSLSRPKFSLKKSFRIHNKYRTNHYHNNNGNEGTTAITNATGATTAFLSVTTPSSQITNIISDQMQILSLVETNMNFKSYNHNNNYHYNNHTTNSTTSSRRQRKSTSLGSDLAGFDYLSHIQKPTTATTSSADNSNSLIYNNGLNYNQHHSSQHSTSSSSSTHTAITSTSMTNTSHSLSSSSESVISSSISTTTSSSSNIPMLSGPLRDSSVMKTKVRKDKVRRAMEMSNYSKMISPPSSGGANSPRRNNGRGSKTSGNSGSTGESHLNVKDFDPFTEDDDLIDSTSMNIMHNDQNGSGSKSDISNGHYNMTKSNSRNHSNNDNTTHANGRLELPPESSSPIQNQNKYIPGSRKLFINVALNEDFSCMYRNSKLSDYTVEGNVQILLKSDSTAFVPFQLILKDEGDQIETLIENVKLASSITTSLDDDYDDTRRFLVTLPKYDHFFEVLKYKCKSKLVPVPLVSKGDIRNVFHGLHYSFWLNAQLFFFYFYLNDSFFII